MPFPANVAVEPPSRWSLPRHSQEDQSKNICTFIRLSAPEVTEHMRPTSMGMMEPRINSTVLFTLASE
jgi:hypothetical protein